MKERPILFSAPMVLANRRTVDPKTVTRRTRGLDRINAEPDAWAVVSNEFDRPGFVHFRYMLDGSDDTWIRCPYGVAGDRLWVKEAWESYRESSPDRAAIMEALWEGVQSGRLPIAGAALSIPVADGETRAVYRADFDDETAREIGPWKSPIFMPHWASRDTLEVVSVRPERLQSITEADAMAEGIMQQAIPDLKGNRFHWGDPSFDRCATASGAYAALWDSINGTGSWAKNPWVWVVSYRRLAVQG